MTKEEESDSRGEEGEEMRKGSEDREEVGDEEGNEKGGEGDTVVQEVR